MKVGPQNTPKITPNSITWYTAPWPQGVTTQEQQQLLNMFSSGALYNVPPQAIAADEKIQSGFAWPNPYVNSSGYGGFFGLGASTKGMTYFGQGVTTATLHTSSTITSYKRQAHVLAAALHGYMTTKSYAATGNLIKALEIATSGDQPANVFIQTTLKGSGLAAYTPNVGASSAGGTIQQATTSLGKMLELLDHALNPKKPGVAASVSSLGTTDLAYIVQLLGGRALLSFMFLGMVGIGVYLMFSGSGSGVQGIFQMATRGIALKQAGERIAATKESESGRSTRHALSLTNQKARTAIAAQRNVLSQAMEEGRTRRHEVSEGGRNIRHTASQQTYQQRTQIAQHIAETHRANAIVNAYRAQTARLTAKRKAGSRRTPPGPKIKAES